MIKRLDSAYEPGARSGSWRKIKNLLRQEVVVAGWKPGQGNRTGLIGSLLIGYYETGADGARRCCTAVTSGPGSPTDPADADPAA